MSATLQSQISFAPEAAGRVSTSVAPTFRGPFGAVRLYIARKHAEFRLNCLSDRVLADIGVARENIPAVVRGHLRRG